MVSTSKEGRPTFFWQRATTVIVGKFADLTCKNHKSGLFKPHNCVICTVYIYTYIHTHTHTYIHTHTCIYIHIHMHVYVCVYIYIQFTNVASGRITYLACWELDTHALEQCFSIFVRPRPGKIFFHKTRARSQQIYS